MGNRQKTAGTNIFSSIRLLSGNTRTSVLFEPLWGIPFVLYNFYFSLYMKELGVTDLQIGYLIAIGYISGTVFSLFGGVITDRLGRRKTTVIFDLIGWPVVMALYALSHSFLVFAFATALNGVARIVNVSWNLMVVEDAANEERVAAFNLLNIINMSTGVIIPVAGLIVSALGLVKSERIFLIYAFISMTIMVLGRNHFYRETSVGTRILEEHKRNPVKINLRNVLPVKAVSIFLKNPAAVIVVLIYVLFNIYLPLGTINSLYFAPYMTEVMKLDKSFISVLGGIYSAVMFAVFVLVIPFISKRFHIVSNMTVGLAIQAVSLVLIAFMPIGSMLTAILCIVVFAVGTGVFKPFIDPIMAEVTDERERAGIYAIYNTFTCITTALIGYFSGQIYDLDPKLIYLISASIIVICVILLAVYKRLPHKAGTAEEAVDQLSS